MTDDCPKIMVIDDDVDIVNVVREVLTTQGYDVVELTHTRNPSAVSKRVASENPTLILLDLMMPEMDGWQVLELLQNDPVTSQTPIIVFTAATQALSDIQEYYGPAVSDYITKPFEVAELLETVERVLAEAEGSHQQSAVSYQLDEDRP
ncbi:MAG: response regulator [Chloroflexi bacterium]|nr:response regulator [Chloroflexota bacterium]